MDDSRSDIDLVYRKAVDHALALLQREGEFFPFAVVMLKRAGDLRLIRLDERQVSDGGPQDVNKVRSVVERGARRNLYQATAVAADVRVRRADSGEATDAIRVEIEHVALDPIACYVPYRLQDDEVRQVADSYVEPGERIVLHA